MKANPTIYRAIILKESLCNGLLPESLRPFLVETYPYLLDGTFATTIFKLEVPAAMSTAVARCVADLLRPEKYFAQLTGEDDLIVVFPHRYVHVVRTQPETAEAARILGMQFGIPCHQMKFEQMFENDHPHIENKGK